MKINSTLVNLYLKERLLLINYSQGTLKKEKFEKEFKLIDKAIDEFLDIKSSINNLKKRVSLIYLNTLNSIDDIEKENKSPENKEPESKPEENTNE